jgi:hypothetical protein
MDMIRPERCPACQGEWVASNTFNNWRSCSNFEICRIKLLGISPYYTQYSILKRFEDGTEIWWRFFNDDYPNTIRWGHQSDDEDAYQKLSFVPPYTISLGRLRALLPFS